LAVYYKVFKKSFAMVFQILLCGECYENVCTLKTYKLSSVEVVERWVACTPLSVNGLVTLVTQYHSGYHCKAIFKTPCITSGSRIEP
jgi:hypothetical protein